MKNRNAPYRFRGFSYGDAEPTIESAAFQSIRWAGPGLNHRWDDATARACAAALCTEIRFIMSTKVATLLDPSGEATEWNEAVELALLIIEGASGGAMSKRARVLRGEGRAPAEKSQRVVTPAEQRRKARERRKREEQEWAEKSGPVVVRKKDEQKDEQKEES